MQIHQRSPPKKKTLATILVIFWDGTNIRGAPQKKRSRLLINLENHPKVHC